MISVVKWGALVGVSSYLILTIGLTLLNSLLFGTSPTDLNHPGSLAFACFGIFGILFAFSAAGYFTGRETRKVGWGVISAMVALIVYYLLGLIYTPGRDTLGKSPATGATNQLPVAAQVLSSIAAAVSFCSWPQVWDGWELDRQYNNHRNDLGYLPCPKTRILCRLRTPVELLDKLLPYVLPTMPIYEDLF